MLNITHYLKNANQNHLTLVRMVINKKYRNSKCWTGCRENVKKKILLHCWWESKWIQPLWRTVWRFLQKLGRKLPYDTAMLLLHMFPEETITEKDTCTSWFTAAAFTIARTWKRPSCHQQMNG